MNLNKSLEFFDPDNIKGACHIIGCGSIGSNIAELLTRQGIKKLTIYDGDIVESHNIVNQIYYDKQIGEQKTSALEYILKDINPDIEIKKKGYWTKRDRLEGNIFLCVDNIETRKKIMKENEHNNAIETVSDFRTTLMEGQHYFTDWNNQRTKISLMKSMEFSHEEAQQNTQVSACGLELSVAPLIKIITSAGVANFMNFVNKGNFKHMIITRPYDNYYEAF